MEPEANPAPESIDAIDHPELGPAFAVLDDRRRTLRSLGLGALWVAVGALGVVMGVGDTTSGDNVGIPFGIFGVVVLLFGLNEMRLNGLRLLRPVRMIVGERGFALADGRGPIPWASVLAVDLTYGRRDPNPIGLRLRIRMPDEGRDRWISVGGGMAMPLTDVATMLRGRMPSRPERRAGVQSRTHPARTSRH